MYARKCLTIKAQVQVLPPLLTAKLIRNARPGHSAKLIRNAICSICSAMCSNIGHMCSIAHMILRISLAVGHMFDLTDGVMCDRAAPRAYTLRCRANSDFSILRMVDISSV